MNKERIRTCIAILQRANAKQFSMIDWQRPVGGRFVDTEGELHACGNAACFAGYLAVSPEFRADGGTSEDGRPWFRDAGGARAVAEYLDITFRIAHSLVNGDTTLIYIAGSRKDYSHYYNKPWVDVTKDDVIAKLEGLLLNGEAP